MNTSAASMNINQVLNQIRVRSQSMSATESQPQTGRTNFADLLRNSIDNVNSLQSHAGSLKTAYEMGDSNVDLPEVMIASQKAGLSFEATVEIRNRVLNAYQEIMNMQI